MLILAIVMIIVNPIVMGLVALHHFHILLLIIKLVVKNTEIYAHPQLDNLEQT
jgi:hypothetical protein